MSALSTFFVWLLAALGVSQTCDGGLEQGASRDVGSPVCLFDQAPPPPDGGIDVEIATEPTKISNGL